MKEKEIFHGSEDKDCISSNRRVKPAEIGEVRNHMAKAKERKFYPGNSILTRYKYCKVFASNSVILAVWMNRKGCASERLSEKGRSSLK